MCLYLHIFSSLLRELNSSATPIKVNTVPHSWFLSSIFDYKKPGFLAEMATLELEKVQDESREFYCKETFKMMGPVKRYRITF